MSHLLSVDPIPSPKTAEDRSTEFVAVEGGRETTSAEALLIAAYGLMWAALLAFVLLTWRRQRVLESKIRHLAETVDRAAGRDVTKT
jgi:hypothetical protein